MGDLAPEPIERLAAGAAIAAFLAVALAVAVLAWCGLWSLLAAARSAASGRPANATARGASAGREKRVIWEMPGALEPLDLPREELERIRALQAELATDTVEDLDGLLREPPVTRAARSSRQRPARPGEDGILWKAALVLEPFDLAQQMLHHIRGTRGTECLADPLEDRHAFVSERKVLRHAHRKHSSNRSGFYLRRRDLAWCRRWDSKLGSHAYV